MGKIVIKDVQNIDPTIAKRFPDDLGTYLPSFRPHNNSNCLKVLFRQEAVEKLWDTISWGEYTYENSREQGGILVGYFCKEEIRCNVRVWVEVCDIIPCEKPEVSRHEYIKMSTENWRQMYSDMDKQNVKNMTDYILVGWYHTHPDRIKAVYSQMDYVTHTNQFTYSYSVGAVFNPHKKEWSVYYGPNCIQAEGFLLLNSQLESIQRKAVMKNSFFKRERPFEASQILPGMDTDGPMELLIQEEAQEQEVDILYYQIKPDRFTISGKIKYIEELSELKNSNVKQDFISVYLLYMTHVLGIKEIDPGITGVYVILKLDMNSSKKYRGIIVHNAFYIHLDDKSEDMLYSYSIPEQMNGIYIGCLILQNPNKSLKDASVLAELIKKLKVTYLMICKMGTKNRHELNVYMLGKEVYE